MNIYKKLRVFNESTQLLEYNRKDLRKWAGDDLTNRYMAIRGKLQAPENDLGYWIKKGNVQEFNDFVSGWESGATKSKTQKKKEERIKGADLITDKDGWKVYHITTYDAAKQLGSGTTWCITGRYRGAESQGKHYFDQYIKDYNLDGYYFIFDTTKTDKVSNDYEKYCAGVDKNNKLVFLYNGLQDNNITRSGIPVEDSSREVDLIPGVEIPFDVIFKVEDGVLLSVSNNFNLSSVKIPDTIYRIGKRCFTNKDSLISVEFPESLTEIGSGAFMKTSLKSVDLKNVEKLGRGVFFNCGYLQEVTIGNKLTEIPADTFGYCSHLSTIKFPNGISKIDDTAFEDCDMITIYGPADNQYLIDFAKKNKFQYLDIDTGEIIDSAGFVKATPVY